MSSHAPKSSSAWAPALPWASQEGDPEQALPQNLLQVAARRLALTPGGTSPGWKGEDHSRFSCGCQSLDTHRAQCSQCWVMPRKSPLCRQAAPTRVHINVLSAASMQYRWGGGVYLLSARATTHATNLSNPQTTPGKAFVRELNECRPRMNCPIGCWSEGASTPLTCAMKR